MKKLFYFFLITGFANSMLAQTITDIDSNSYDTVQIGKQVWLKENLKTTHYSNGDIIPIITDDNSWGSNSSGAYCWYNNDTANRNQYGALYNWYAAADSRNVCPVGWHVPTNGEWEELSNYLGGDNFAGGNLKEIGTVHWLSPNTGATNETGFTALPGGFRAYWGGFFSIAEWGKWWSSAKHDADSAWYQSMNNTSTYAGENYYLLNDGFSVRCLKNSCFANAGLDQINISGTQVQLAANYPVGTTFKHWYNLDSITNGGTFNNPYIENTLFNGAAGKTYHLVWVLQNACGTTKDTVVVSFAGSGGTLTIQKTSTPPTINNTVIDTAAWGNISETQAALWYGVSISGFSSGFKMCYDDSNLYVLVQIQDSTPHSTANNILATYNNDALELFFQMDIISNPDGSYTTGDYQLRKERDVNYPVGLDGEFDNTFTPNGSSLSDFTNNPGMKIAEFDNGKVYYQEWQIPWQLLTKGLANNNNFPTTPGNSWDGQNFRWDMQAANNVDGTGRAGQIFVFNNSNNDYFDTRGFGKIKLETPIIFNAPTGPKFLIPDSNFRKYLQNTYPDIMFGDSLIISQAVNIDLMDCSARNIQNLDGLQYFTNLMYLVCENNNLHTLPFLTNLVNLHFLRCRYDSLTTLPDLSALTKLDTFLCSHNQLTMLPNLSTLVQLHQFSCGDNKLTTLPDISALTQMRDFECYSNHLTVLPDMSAMVNLQIIYCESDQLISLPDLSALTNLQYLFCWSNQLTSLPGLSTLTNLIELNCDTNQLTSMPDLSALINLQNLNCRYNNLKKIPSLPNGLCSLSAIGNDFNCLPNVPSGSNCGSFTCDIGTDVCTALDSGAQWNRSYFGQNSKITDLSVVNNNIVCGLDWNKDSIFITTDGGVSWKSKPLPIPDGYTRVGGGICALSASKAYCIISISDSKGIYLTTDTGNTWKQQTTSFNKNSPFPDVVYFWNENEGIAIGDADTTNTYFEIYTTSNGGIQWNRVPDANMPNGNKEYTWCYQSSYRIIGNSIFFQTNSARIFKSFDKGITWSVINTPFYNTSLADSIITFDFKDNNNGLVSYCSSNGAYHKIYKTIDGGQTWDSMASNKAISQLKYIPTASAYFGLILNGGLGYSSDNGKTGESVHYFNNINLSAISYSQEGKIFLGDNNGNIYYLSPFLNVSTDAISLPANANSKSSFIVNSSINWNVSIDQSWLTISKVSGSNNDTITLTATANINNNPRTSIVTISGIGVSSQTITITQEAIFHADFSYTFDNTRMQFTFTNKSSSSVTNWYWTFGDGSMFSGPSVEHNYTKSGSYEVCLTVIDTKKQATDKKCKQIQVGDMPCYMSAEYSFTTDNLEIKFDDMSKGNIVNWYWDFGDGNTSTDSVPVHDYTKAGYYLVSLAVSDLARKCSDYYADMIMIGDMQCVASFNYFVTEGTKDVKFTNTSEGTLASFYWDFNDGTTVTTKDAQHTFAKEGLYSISLTVANSDLTCMDNTIIPVQVGSISCNADFTYAVDSATVFFTDKITGESSNILWSFGDGNISVSHNPVHKYTAQGYYTVGLNTYNRLSGCMDFYQEVILVGNAGIDCEADFLYTFDPNIALKVLFNDNSKGNIEWYVWNYGDGNMETDLKNPKPNHLYNTPGFYNVCLDVINNFDVSNLTCKKVGVATTTNTNCLADFEFNIDSASKTASFTDKSFGGPNKWEWDFGDKSVSTDTNPSHPYSNAGYYLISLKITSSGCSDKTYKLIDINQLNNGLKAGFGYDPQKGKKSGGYPVDFIGVGLGDQSRLRWTFGDSTNNIPNTDTTTTTPTHSYANPGTTYHVCYQISDPITGQSDSACHDITTTTTDIPVITTHSSGLSAYPNPFGNNTTITFELTMNTLVELKVLDFSGRLVKTIVNTTKVKGKYSLNWNGSGIESGCYILQLKTPYGSWSKIIAKQ